MEILEESIIEGDPMKTIERNAKRAGVGPDDLRKLIEKYGLPNEPTLAVAT